MVSSGRIASESKVVVGVFAWIVPVVEGTGVGVLPSVNGRKGVRVGVAFGGTVTRNRVVGEAADAPLFEPPREAAQAVNTRKMSGEVRNIRLQACNKKEEQHLSIDY